MTANRNLKRKVRARAAKTGQSYTTALRHFRQRHFRQRHFRQRHFRQGHFRSTPTGEVMPGTKPARLAVAQTTMRSDPRDSGEIRAGGRDARRMMSKAREAGATLVHFPESAICVPDKHILSGGDPAETGPANWELFAWDALRLELTAIAELAGELGLWTVVGSTHRLTAPNRPHNTGRHDVPVDVLGQPEGERTGQGIAHHGLNRDADGAQPGADDGRQHNARVRTCQMIWYCVTSSTEMAPRSAPPTGTGRCHRRGRPPNRG
jgi:hypothetical protein